DPSFMVSAVREVLGGTQVLSPDIAGKLERAALLDVDQPTLGLSTREFEVFRLLATGRTHEEIGALLSLSPKTVANNHSLIKQKLGINSDIELLQLAIGCGAIESTSAPA